MTCDSALEAPARLAATARLVADAAGEFQPMATVLSSPPALKRAALGIRTSGFAVARQAHLVGIGGSGMKALAEYLAGAGWQVSGSDLSISADRAKAFVRRGIRPLVGHSSDHVTPDTSVVVYSPAVPEANPERVTARRLGIPEASYTEMLGLVMADRVGISIAGTHGKSTTTAMTGRVLRAAGYDPSVILGADTLNEQQSGWFGSGQYFVAESCEFQRNFLDLSPDFAAILSIEPDHFDCFATFDKTVEAFAEFAARLPAHGLLLIPAASVAARDAARGAVARVVTFGLEPYADWQAVNVTPSAAGATFDITNSGANFGGFSLQVPGPHNVLNALAAAAMCGELGLSGAEVQRGLGDFTGVGRRFELSGEWRGVPFVDDYAHHPTAVEVTLRTARERFPGRRLWVAFQPHQVSRTRALMHEFAESFLGADRILIAPVFAARETVTDEPVTVSGELVHQIAERGGHVRFCESLDHVRATLEYELQPGDVVLTMGAGNINQVQNGFTRQVQRDHQP